MKQLYVLMAGTVPVCVYLDRDLAFNVRKSMSDAANQCHLSVFYHVEIVNYDERALSK